MKVTYVVITEHCDNGRWIPDDIVYHYNSYAEATSKYKQLLSLELDTQIMATSLYSNNPTSRRVKLITYK
jgi:hypothetical protein